MFRHVALLLALGGVILCGAPTLAQAEVIREFNSTYVIQTDGTVLVEENIVYDFEEASRHGIFRTLETDHVLPASVRYKVRTVDIEVIGVQRDGDSELYSLSRSDTGLEIKIGDKDRTITGAHVYNIRYKLLGALSYLSDGQVELYWNATGNRWPVVMEKVVVEVIGLKNLLLNQPQACYVGVPGSTVACDITTEEQMDKYKVTFSTHSLAPGSELTIAQSVNPSLVATLIKDEIRWSLIFSSIKEKISKWNFILIPLLVLMAVGFLYRTYRVNKRYVRKETVVAQYEPYLDLLPMYTGTVYDGQLDFADITAGIVYLAEQGFIKIKQTEEKVLLFFDKRDYELTLLRPISEIPDESSQWILHLLFDPSIKNGLWLNIKNLVKPEAVWAPAEVGKTVLMSELLQNRSANSRAVSGMQLAFAQRLLSDGYFEKPPNALDLPSGRYYLVIFIWLLVTVAVLVLVSIGLAAFLAITLLFGLIYGGQPRQTSKGYEAKQHLLGFKEFLSVTDKDRFDFHNAPERNADLFMKYLPFAIALGVEQKWAAAFDGMMIPPPSWYENGHVGAFVASNFAADMKTFSSAVASSNSVTRSGGASGGGSAGGGGGGGGGGSW